MPVAVTNRSSTVPGAISLPGPCSARNAKTRRTVQAVQGISSLTALRLLEAGRKSTLPRHGTAEPTACLRFTGFGLSWTTRWRNPAMSSLPINAETFTKEGTRNELPTPKRR